MIYVIGYLIGIFTTMYVLRRINPVVWKYRASHTQDIKKVEGYTEEEIKSFENEVFSFDDIIFYSILWGIILPCHLSFICIKTVCKIVAGQNSIFSMLDWIIDVAIPSVF